MLNNKYSKLFLTFLKKHFKVFPGKWKVPSGSHMSTEQH